MRKSSHRSWFPPYPPPGRTTSRAADLHAPLLSAGRLTGGEGPEEAFGQPALCIAECGGHRLGNFVVGEDVALSGEAVPGDAQSVLETVLAGVRGAAAVGGDHPDLPMSPHLVVGNQTIDRVRWRKPGFQQFETAVPVGDLGICLSGHGSNSSPCPRNKGADGEELGLDGHPTVPRLGVSAHDRIGRWSVGLGSHVFETTRRSVAEACRFGQRLFVVEHECV